MCPDLNSGTLTKRLILEGGDMKTSKVKRDFSFIDDLGGFFGLLMMTGAMCPKCGYGTRKTSKNWLRCKRETCGERLHLVPATKELIESNAKILERELARVSRAEAKRRREQ